MPKWQILVVRSGQPETLLEASKAWTSEQRLSARMSFSLVYHAMISDVMAHGQPRPIYTYEFSGAALRAHAWRTKNNVCLYVSSVAFGRGLPPPDSCDGLDALAYESFDQTSVAVLTRAGRTWIFEQTQGDPILSPLLMADCDTEEPPPANLCEAETPACEEQLTGRPESAAATLKAAWLEAWRRGSGARALQMPVPITMLDSPAGPFPPAAA